MNIEIIDVTPETKKDMSIGSIPNGAFFTGLLKYKHSNGTVGINGIFLKLTIGFMVIKDERNAYTQSEYLDSYSYTLENYREVEGKIMVDLTKTVKR